MGAELRAVRRRIRSVRSTMWSLLIAAATLNLGNTLILAALSFVSVSVIAVFHRPLPWEADSAFTLPALICLSGL